MSAVTKSDILKLYKNCHIYINSLKYSDKDFLRSRLRQEFRKEIAEDKLDIYYNKGLSFLNRSRFA